jgi:hypothetical protein
MTKIASPPDLDPTSPLFDAHMKARFAGFIGGRAMAAFHHYMESGVTLQLEESQGLKQIVLVAQPLPPEISLTLAASIHNFRSSLDTAISALMDEATGHGGSRSHFPFAETKEELLNEFETGERQCPSCGDRRLRNGRYRKVGDRLPEFKSLVMDTFRPWKSGNTLLWSLNKLDNVLKHRMMLLLIGDIRISGADFVATRGKLTIMSEANRYQIVPGRRYTIMQTTDSLQVYGQTKAEGQLLFGDQALFHGRPVGETIVQLFDLTTSIIETLESHFKQS